MNYMNDLLEGRITPEEHQNEYCKHMIDLLKQHIDEYYEDRERFICTFGAFKDLNRKDRENLMDLIESILPENLGKPKSRFCDEKYVTKESDYIPKIKKYTDKMLLRVVANEMCQADLNINITQSRSNNNHMYHILKRLGLDEMKRDPYIPEIVPGNYRLLRQMIGLENKIQKLLETEERMSFLIDYLEKNPKEAAQITGKNMDDIMRDGKIERIIKLRHGNMKTMESIVEENLEKGESLFEKAKGIRIEKNRFDSQTPGGKLLSDIVSRKGKDAKIVDASTYKELYKMGYDISFKSGMPVLKSGYQYYESIITLNILEEEINKRIKENSKVISQYPRVTNYYRHKRKQENTPQDKFIINCILYYEDELAKQKANEKGLMDTVAMIGEKAWNMSQFIADGMINIENWLISKSTNVRRRFNNKLNNIGNGVELREYEERDHDEPLVFIERLTDEQIEEYKRAKELKKYERRVRKEAKEAKKAKKTEK